MKAQDEPAQAGSDLSPTSGRKPTVALALGAGGAKGLAHIGAIEEIEAQGYAITAIAGSSIGALIGGIHAAGKLDVYRDWAVTLAKFDMFKLVDWTFSGGGLIKGDKLIDTLSAMIGDVQIEELPLTFTAVATDIVRGREVWLSRGSLFDAIRASIAIPTVFRPHTIGGRLLMDGALLNPVPVTPLIRECADYLIAVSLDGAVVSATAPEPPVRDKAAPESYRERIGEFIGRILPNGNDSPREPGTFELLAASMDLMQANLAHMRLAAYQPDLLIELPRNVASAYEFYRARELIELGRAQARIALGNWPHAGTPLRDA